MPLFSLAELDTLFAEALSQGIFPGAVFGLACGPPAARQTTIKVYGRLWAAELHLPDNPAMHEEVVFDLASLTKPLATVLATLCLKRRGLLHLNDCLPSLLGRTVPVDKCDITLAQLLQHSSGLPAHRPYFERLRALPADKRRDALLEMLLAEPLESLSGSKAVYSDLGFILLGRIIEEQSNEPLDAFVTRWLYAPLNLQEKIAFNPLGRPVFKEGSLFAPTEDCPWRGEVHDDNAHAMGGVAGHAGLFGTAGAVLTLTRFLLDLLKGQAAHPHLAATDLHDAVRRSNAQADSTWGLGFDTPSANQSSAGHLLSRSSFGHLGFTGTSFWCDPERDIAVVLLTNRVHPSRHNARIRDFRPRFHDAVTRYYDAMS